MAKLSAAEKQQRYRLKRDADPERRSAYLAKEKEKYEIDKKVGKKKLVENMTNREHRAVKKQWREYKRSTKKKKNLQEILTPPDTPETTQQNQESRQKIQSNRKRNREKSKLQRKISLLEKQLYQERKRSEMYRKRSERKTKSQEDERRTKSEEDTPRTKTRKLLRNFSNKTVRKTLFFHNVLINGLSQSYKSGGRKTKQQIADIIRGNILRKYKLKVVAEKEIGCFVRQAQLPKKGSLTQRLKTFIRDFYLRDDVSRITTGLKNTITRHKVKRQKRLLNDTLLHLHQKFISETKNQISYESFTRLRPFWVTFPTELDRETCLCKTCENLRFLAKKLQDINIIKSTGMESLVRFSTCDIQQKNCMYGLCAYCKEKRVIETVPKSVNDEVTWHQWKSQKETRIIKGVAKDITTTVKATEKGTVGDLIEKFHEQLWRYRKHSFNITNQFKHYKHIRENLKENECLMHVDFSENFVCKLAAEIQSMHFGGSKQQITLHTGAYFIGNGDNSKCVTFSTISDSLQHDPAAIWAHLHPVLSAVRTNYPKVEYIHFFSDGPTSQYRQKGNFYLLSKTVFEMGFKGSTWNFHEAGHGKGIPDGVGGTLKRMADRKIRNGSDITSAMSFITELESETGIKLYLVSHEEIEKKNQIPQSLKPIPGTMKLHQIVTNAPGQLYYRDVSCTCSIEKSCKEHAFQKFAYSISNSKLTNSNKRKPSPMVTKKKKMRANTSTGNEKWETFLEELQTCEGFEELKEKCRRFEIGEIEGSPRNLSGNSLAVDEMALDIYPEDVPGGNIMLCPTKVRADGDCLPSTGSTFAFGHEDRADEIRSRIVVELALHEELYLSQEHLRIGLGVPESQNLAKIFAMFSDMYLPGICLSNEIIKSIYEKEVMEITKQKTYMGIWQLFGLASVLQMPVFSVYPKLGNPNVRKSLHRIVKPRIQKTTSVAYIMWSSTRTDMQHGNWVPNHFVPVLTIDEIEIRFNSDTGNYEEKQASQGIRGIGEENIECQGVGSIGEETEDDNRVRDIGEEEKGVIRGVRVNKEEERVDSKEEGDIEKGEKDGQVFENTTEEKGSDARVNKNREGENVDILKGNIEDGDKGVGQGITIPNGEKGVDERVRDNGEEEKGDCEKDGNIEVREKGDGQEVRNTKEKKDDNMPIKDNKDEENIDNVEGDIEESETGVDQGIRNAEDTRVGKQASDNGKEENVDGIEEDFEGGKKRSDQRSTEMKLRESKEERDNEEEGQVDCLVDENIKNGEKSHVLRNTENKKGYEEGHKRDIDGVVGIKENEGDEHGDNGEEVKLGSQGVEYIDHKTRNDLSDRGILLEEKNIEQGMGEEADRHSVKLTNEEKGDQRVRDIGEEKKAHGQEVNVIEKDRNDQVVRDFEDEEKGSGEDVRGKQGHQNFMEYDEEHQYGLIADMNIHASNLNQFINKYVVVLYDNEAYPGYVEDVEKKELFCECMQKVGKRENCFYWPKRKKDKCWYEMKNVIAIIPQPQKNEGSNNFSVKTSFWRQIQLSLHKKSVK